MGTLSTARGGLLAAAVRAGARRVERQADPTLGVHPVLAGWGRFTSSHSSHPGSV